GKNDRSGRPINLLGLTRWHNKMHHVMMIIIMLTHGIFQIGLLARSLVRIFMLMLAGSHHAIITRQRQDTNFPLVFKSENGQVPNHLVFINFKCSSVVLLEMAGTEHPQVDPGTASMWLLLLDLLFGLLLLTSLPCAVRKPEKRIENEENVNDYNTEVRFSNMLCNCALHVLEELRCYFSPCFCRMHGQTE
ncbi:hypothetical protein ACJX0J_023805, partial [Zea mays]